MRGVPCTGEVLSVGQVDSHQFTQEGLHDRSEYGKRYRSPWGRHTLRTVRHPTDQLVERPGANERVVVGPRRKYHTVHQ